MTAASRHNPGSAPLAIVGFQVVGTAPGATTTKPEKIGRVYALESAAHTCAQLAQRAGWTNVSVQRLTQRRALVDDKTGWLV